MVDFDDLKKLATLPTHTMPVCVAGELADQVARLELQMAEAAPASNIGEASPRRAIAEQIEAKRAEMREATFDFRLVALPARPWALFYLTMPSRKEGESAEDWEPRNYAWQADMVSRSCVEPRMTVAQVGELVDLLNGRTWAELVSAAFMLNMGEVEVPNSAAASELIEDSEQL